MLFTRKVFRANLWLSVAALIGSVLAVSGPTIATANTVARLAEVGAVPRLPRGAAEIGILPSRTPLRVIVTLKPRNPVALSHFATQVSTPGSPYYRHYLPPGVFPRVFGPTQRAIRSVEAALRRAGLQSGTLSSSHLAIMITASARDVERAFAVHFKRYRLAGGRLAYASTTPPKFPASAAPYVQAVLGLDDLYLPQPAGSQAVPSLSQPRGRPWQTRSGGPQPTCQKMGEETANRLASAYNFSALYAAGDYGAKMTVGLIELEPNLKSDISGYENCYTLNGKSLTTTVNYIRVPGAASVGKGAGTEATFDIEDVIGLAPKATIAVYQGGPGIGALYTDEQYAVAEDTAQVLSISYDACEPDDTYASAENTVFEQAAVQGQSVLVASGDRGSEGCTSLKPADKTLEVDDPASQPYVTSVGGTVLLKPGPPPNEVTWNDCQGQKATCTTKPPRFYGASGGGISVLWPMPSYQLDAPAKLNVISSLSSAVQRCPGAGPGHYCREVPDVSANAGSGRAGISTGGGYAGYINASWQYFDGTSFAAPLWAAGLALIDEKSGNIGFANPALYAIAGGPGYKTAFHDVTSGNNDYTDTQHGDYPAGTGYDMATGLGTPNFGGLATAMDLYLRSWAPQAAAKPANAAQLTFRGVSCTSATACTAVGSYFDKSYNYHLLAETWNGTRWSLDKTPAPSGASASGPLTFSGVSCTSGNSCTAVGSYYTQAGDSRIVAEEWNGSSWSLQPIPIPAGATQNSLLGVSCVTANYCIATGSTSAAPGTLAEIWDGARWSIMSTPNPGTGSGGSLNAISCTATTSCIAVGGNGKATLAEYWNGTKWSVQATPKVTTQYPPQLNSVSCTSPAACTAVGSDLQTPFAESWNGTIWKRQATPIKTFYFNDFDSVSCVTSAHLCTAVGSYIGDGQGADDFGYAAYWDGKSWTLESADHPKDFSETLYSVSCISPTTCVAVGSGILAEGR